MREKHGGQETTSRGNKRREERARVIQRINDRKQITERQKEREREREREEEREQALCGSGTSNPGSVNAG